MLYEQTTHIADVVAVRRRRIAEGDYDRSCPLLFGMAVDQSRLSAAGIRDALQHVFLLQFLYQQRNRIRLPQTPATKMTAR